MLNAPLIRRDHGQSNSIKITNYLDMNKGITRLVVYVQMNLRSV